MAGVMSIALKRSASQSGTGIFLVLVALVCFFYAVDPIFLSATNVGTMMRALSYSGIIAIGMAICLISGIIDLSVGSTAALSSVIFGTAMKEWGVSLWPAAGIALAVGAAVGLINSYLILKLKIIPFIATISMMFMLRGLANWVSNGYQVYPLPPGALEIGSARPLGTSWAFVAFVAVALIADLVLRYSLLGLLFRAVGSDRETAMCTEVDVNQVNTVALVAISILAALAGVFISFMTNSGSPTVGSGWEFTAITACAIGGVSLFGYHGSIFGLFCGLATIQVIQNGIVMMGVSPYLQTVVVGAILLGAMYADIKRRTYLDLDTI